MRGDLCLFTGKIRRRPGRAVRMGSAWDDVQPGSGKFVVLKADGDFVRGVPIGDPRLEVVKTRGGADRKRYYLNFLVDGDDDPSILPMNVTTAARLKEELTSPKAKEPADLCGKVRVEIRREGAPGSLDTKYPIKVVGKLKPAEMKKLAALELNDLSVIETDSAKAKF